MFNTKRLLLILGILGLVVIGCKDNSENKSSAEKKVSIKKEKKVDGFATIHLEDGKIIELKPKGQGQSGTLNPSSSLSVNMHDFNVIVMLRLKDYDSALETKVYNNPQADIAIRNVGKDSPLDEDYRSYFENEDGKEGETQLTITSIGENYAEGTYTGTLFSKSHKKATIEGKFILKIKKK